jgi:hypothetical protein
MAQIRKCWNGPTCKYYAKGICRFSHVEEWKKRNELLHLEPVKNCESVILTEDIREEILKLGEETLQRLTHDNNLQHQVIDELNTIKENLEGLEYEHSILNSILTRVQNLNFDEWKKQEDEKLQKKRLNLGTGKTCQALLVAEKFKEKYQKQPTHDEQLEKDLVEELWTNINNKLQEADNTQDVETECQLRIDALKSRFAISRAQRAKEEEKQVIVWKKGHDEEQKKRILSDGSSVYEMKEFARKMMTPEKFAEFDRACFKKAPENYLALLFSVGCK